MSCDPQTLVTQASCIECQIPTGMQLPVLISLLCQIVTNGGTGGGGLSFNSGNTALTNATSYSFTHGLGTTPSKVRAVMVCTANDANTGYVAGDEIETENLGDTLVSGGNLNVCSVSANATTITVSFIAAFRSTTSFIQKGGTGKIVSSSTNNFALKVYAST